MAVQEQIDQLLDEYQRTSDPYELVVIEQKIEKLRALASE